MVKEMKVKTYELNLWCGYFYELIKKGIIVVFSLRFRNYFHIQILVFKSEYPDIQISKQLR